MKSSATNDPKRSDRKGANPLAARLCSLVVACFALRLPVQAADLSPREQFQNALSLLNDRFVAVFSREGMLEYSIKEKKGLVVYYRAGVSGSAFFVDRNTEIETQSPLPGSERVVFGKAYDGMFWRAELSRPYRDVILTSRPEDNGGKTKYMEEIESFALLVDPLRALGIMMLVPSSISWDSEQVFHGESRSGGEIRGRVGEVENGHVSRIEYEIPMQPPRTCAVRYLYGADSELPPGIPTSMILLQLTQGAWSELGTIGIHRMETSSTLLPDSSFMPASFLQRIPPEHDEPAILVETNKLLLQLVQGRLEPVTLGAWQPPGGGRFAWQNLLLVSVIVANVGFLLLFIWWRRRKNYGHSAAS